MSSGLYPPSGKSNNRFSLVWARLTDLDCLLAEVGDTLTLCAGDLGKVHMSLSNFLKSSINTTTRENIFFNKLYFDLKLAAAKRDYPLQVFIPEVDRFGFDVILDDGDVERRFQLKSFAKSADTASWDIYKRLLRPSYRNAPALTFERSPEGVGLEGGVILIEIDDSSDECPVTYYYTDIFIVTALAHGLISSERGKRVDQASTLLTRLHEGGGHDRVSVPIRLFLKIRSPSTLLAIGGFHSVEESYLWWVNLLAPLSNGFRVGETPRLTDAGARTFTAKVAVAVQSLLSLIDEPELSSFENS
jgi:hypothetical protein